MVSYQPLECILFVFLLSIYFPTIYAQEDNTTQPLVTIPQGTLLGTTPTSLHNRSFSAFLGIPYAQPPIGNLRFANPVAAEGWNGTRKAGASPSVCPQFMGTVIEGDEDCLYINVHTPETTPASLLPVMVWIHGGGFTRGAGTTFWHSPNYLLDANVVLVTMNYRLSALGFLSTGDEVAPGNWGFKDQVLALKWVQDNIRYFGGDPDQVTLFGQSAGAASVHLLTLSNTTIGLFHKYITMSGSALTHWTHKSRAVSADSAFKIGEYVGCNNDTSDALISCLRTVNYSSIISASESMATDGSFTYVIWGMTDEPDIEGAFLTDSPANLLAGGNIRDLPWMSGVTRDEGLLYTAALYEDDESLNDLWENFDTIIPSLMTWSSLEDSGAAWTQAVKTYYFNDDFTANRSELLANLTNLVGDVMFNYPAIQTLEKHHPLASNPQYLYFLNYRGTLSYTFFFTGNTNNYGVSHGDDLIYLLPSETRLSMFDKTMSETDYEIVDTIVQLWTSFAINGTPTTSAMSSTKGWEPWSTTSPYLRIGNDSDTALEIQYSMFPERMQFWADLIATSVTPSDDSGARNLSMNLLCLLLVGCLKFIF